MATITETPKQELEKKGRAVPVIAAGPAKVAPSIPYRPLFSDSILEKPEGESKRKSFTTLFSFSFQMVLLGIMAIVPLMFTEALPKAQLLTFLVAPPPPPPPPPPAAPKVQAVRETDVTNNGALRTPTRIPQKVQMIKEEDTPPPAMEGVVGGVPGGIPGGQVGGVIGSIITPHTMTAVPKLEPPKRVRVSQGVTQGMLVRRIEPPYPKIALAARITGAVQLKAIIGKDGVIRELEVVSGHPMLIPAALDAVKQWRYRPYLLNGEAVEVETNITVTFQIAG
jgi:periplasmic protein TonB